MKNIRRCLFVFLFCLIVSTVYADEGNPTVYQYENPEVTVIFSEPLAMSAERQHEIADDIAGVSSTTITNPSLASPDNIICTLFGHNLAPTVTVTATHHKVNPHVPRCLMEVYHVTYCTRCDYAVKELDNSFYIFCCPED
jgi:hypothetical protein